MSMDIAWLTPWNDRSAIASFSVDVVAELRKRGHSVRIFRSEVDAALDLQPLPDDSEVRALNIVHPQELRRGFDHVVANIGNHFPYHGALPRVLDAVPALGIFHDGFLAHFAAPWAQFWSANEHAPMTLADMVYGDPSPSGHNYWLPLEDMAAKRPMLEWVGSMVAGALTHSGHWAERLRVSCPGEVTIQPLSMPDDAMPPPRPWGERIVLATIGHINRNKQADQVLRGIASHPALRDRCEYHLLGQIEQSEREHLNAVALSLGMMPPSFTGWLEDAELRQRIAEVDVICCLRNPLLEAGSASLITAMRSARPVLVSNHGSYAEVPGDIVLRCTPGSEAPDLARHLLALLEAPEQAAELGQRARAYTFEVNTAASYVDALLPAMEAATAAAPQISAARLMGRQLGKLGLSAGHPQVLRTAQNLSDLLGYANKDVLA